MSNFIDAYYYITGLNSSGVRLKSYLQIANAMSCTNFVENVCLSFLSPRK